MKARLLAKAYSPMAITELRPFVCLLFLTDELSLTAEAEEAPSNNGAKNFLKSPLSKYLHSMYFLKSRDTFESFHYSKFKEYRNFCEIAASKMIWPHYATSDVLVNETDWTEWSGSFEAWKKNAPRLWRRTAVYGHNSVFTWHNDCTYSCGTSLTARHSHQFDRKNMLSHAFRMSFKFV